MNRWLAALPVCLIVYAWAFLSRFATVPLRAGAAHYAAVMGAVLSHLARRSTPDAATPPGPLADTLDGAVVALCAGSVAVSLGVTAAALFLLRPMLGLASMTPRQLMHSRAACLSMLRAAEHACTLLALMRRFLFTRNWESVAACGLGVGLVCVSSLLPSVIVHTARWRGPHIAAILAAFVALATWELFGLWPLPISASVPVDVERVPGGGVATHATIGIVLDVARHILLRRKLIAPT